MSKSSQPLCMPSRPAKRRVLLLMSLCVLLPGAAIAESQPIKPTQSWQGQLRDDALRKQAPQNQIIIGEKAWKTLWQAWRNDEKTPQVDFKKNFVVVATIDGPNRMFGRYLQDDKGNLQVLAGGTKRGGPGFGYLLAVLPRQGIETVNGKPLSAPAGAVTGTFVIDKTAPTFTEQRLEIFLWEYDPFLADASAKKIDEFIIKSYGHAQGTKTETRFSLGTNWKPRKDRKYYVTAFVLKDGQRTHMGEVDGKRGLGKVLQDGNQTKVTLIARVLNR